MKDRIAFIGLGIMGAPMALNLVKNGYKVHVFGHHKDVVDRLVTAGAHAAKSEAAAAAQSEITITMVQNGPQAQDAILGVNGVLQGCSKGHLIIDMSSIAPEVSQAIATTCAIHDVSFMDAPVSGGEPGAIEGTLAIMAGGQRVDFERAQPVFDVLGKSAVLCGRHGAGGTTKLANQIVVAGNIYALSEALVLVSRAGLNPTTVFNAIKNGLAGSAVMNAKALMMVEHNFKPGFRVELHLKDINNAVSTANELGLNLKLTEKLQEILATLDRQGDGLLDHAGIVKFVEETAR